MVTDTPGAAAAYRFGGHITESWLNNGAARCGRHGEVLEATTPHNTRYEWFAPGAAKPEQSRFPMPRPVPTVPKPLRQPTDFLLGPRPSTLAISNIDKRRDELCRRESYYLVGQRPTSSRWPAGISPPQVKTTSKGASSGGSGRRTACGRERRSRTPNHTDTPGRSRQDSSPPGAQTIPAAPTPAEQVSSRPSHP